MVVLGVACFAAVAYGPPDTLSGLLAGSIAILIVAYFSGSGRAGRETSGVWASTRREVTPPPSLSVSEYFEAIAARQRDPRLIERLAMIVILNEATPARIWQSRLENLMRDPEFRAVAAAEMSEVRNLSEEIINLSNRQFTTSCILQPNRDDSVSMRLPLVADERSERDRRARQ